MTMVMVLGLLLISIDPSHVLWGLMVAYGVSGYVGWVVQRWRAEAKEKQYQSLHDAIDEGNMAALSRMLKTVSPDTVAGEGGRSILMVAVEESNLPAIELLLARGANADHRDERGTVALSLAAEMGFQEAVEMLLASGADPNARDLSGMTALDVAEEHGFHDIVSAMLRGGGQSGRDLPPAQS
jgi:ankyrin repeat protein